MSAELNPYLQNAILMLDDMTPNDLKQKGIFLHYYQRGYRTARHAAAELAAAHESQSAPAQQESAPAAAGSSQQTAPAAAQQDALDAARYRWLRNCDWFSSELCVLRNPKKVLTSGAGLGADCPSRDRLDAAVDSAIAAMKGQ